MIGQRPEAHVGVGSYADLRRPSAVRLVTLDRGSASDSLKRIIEKYSLQEQQEKRPQRTGLRYGRAASVNKPRRGR